MYTEYRVSNTWNLAKMSAICRISDILKGVSETKAGGKLYRETSEDC